MRIVRLLAAVLLAGVAIQAATVAAQAPPTRFYGSVTVNGAPAEVGTVVEGYVNGLLCGQGVVAELGDPIGIGYILDVNADSFQPGCGMDGGQVTFKVGALDAAATGEFRTGSFVQVDLSIDGDVGAAPAPPPPPPAEELPVPEPQPEAPPADPQPEAPPADPQPEAPPEE